MSDERASSITSRLREFNEWCVEEEGWEAAYDGFVDIADEIDAEVDAIRHECSETIDRLLNDSLSLPRDANGNVLHIGDMVTGGNRFFRKYKSLHKSLPVECLSYDSKGWKVWVIDPQFGCGYDFGCKEVQVVRRDQT